MTAWLRIAASIALLVALAAPGGAEAAVRSRLAPADFAGLGFDQKLGASLPLDLVFRDEDGRAAPLRRLFHGAPVILVLEYMHCPSLCGLALGNLVQSLAQSTLKGGRDFEVVAVSIDPREKPPDAVSARAQYRARYKDAGDLAGWHFLTGTSEAIGQLAAAVGFPYRYDPEIDQYAHPAGLTVATGSGVVSSYLLGVDHQPAELKLNILGASSGTIAAPAARLLLLCYGYDPQNGRYTSLIETIVQLACLATLLTMASLIGGALWRERKRRGGA